MSTYFLAILCVFMLAIGQILFKLSSLYIVEEGSFLAPKVIYSLFFAFSLYGIATLAWVWVLQRADLGRVYPLMALAFVLVPVGSYFVFGERFNLQYVFGVVLIGVGIVIAVRS